MTIFGSDFKLTQCRLFCKKYSKSGETIFHVQKHAWSEKEYFKVTTFANYDINQIKLKCIFVQYKMVDVFDFVL